jgi:hypothetical protein
MSTQIIYLLKLLKFERNLLSGGLKHGYYKFYNDCVIEYYFDTNINKNTLKLSSSKYSTMCVIEDEKKIIDTLTTEFKDQIDIIREFKLKSIGI